MENEEPIKMCQKCLNTEHTRKECQKIKRREYMRIYMHHYTEGKVAYRRWSLKV